MIGFVGYSTSNMKQTGEVRYACTKYVHLRFLLPQVAFHLLDSERPLFEPLLEEVVQKADVDNDDWLRRLFDIEYETNLGKVDEHV